MSLQVWSERGITEVVRAQSERDRALCGYFTIEKLKDRPDRRVVLRLHLPSLHAPNRRGGGTTIEQAHSRRLFRVMEEGEGHCHRGERGRCPRGASYPQR